MSRRKPEDKRKLPPFVPSLIGTTETPAWKALSMGARVLYLQLKRHHFPGIKNNNGKVYLSERRAAAEIGASNRDSVRRWFRELQHFGFIIKTAEGSLGLDGKGKAPQWRLTELDAPNTDQPRATRDYEKWDGKPFNGNQAWRGKGQKQQKQNPGPETRSRVGAKRLPLVDLKQRLLEGAAGRDSTSISNGGGGRETTSISRVTTPMPLEGGSRSAPPQSAVASEPLDIRSTAYSPTSPSREEDIAALERQAHGTAGQHGYQSPSRDPFRTPSSSAGADGVTSTASFATALFNELLEILGIELFEQRNDADQRSTRREEIIWIGEQLALFESLFEDDPQMDGRRFIISVAGEVKQKLQPNTVVHTVRYLQPPLARYYEQLAALREQARKTA